jgi:group I intron endonuclease
MTPISGIYFIRNHLNGHTYIGSSVNVRRRWTQHKHYLRAGRHNNPKLQNSWSKNGEAAFDFGMLCHEADRKRMITLEDQYLISEKPYYNCQAATATGRVDPTMTFRQRVSAALKGRKHSEEHKRKIGEAHKGQKRSPEACLNIGVGSKGRKHSEETKAKIRQAGLGHHCSEATRAKMSASQKGRIIPESTREASRQYWARRREEKVRLQLQVLTNSGPDDVFPPIPSGR